MLTIFIGAIIIGIAIAAPVGPIGVLCLRHTLRFGGQAGLAAGMGAATADALYGLAAALGLTLISQILPYATPIKMVGASLLLMMGGRNLYSFAQHKRQKAADINTRSRKFWRIYVKTMALTLTNPMTIVSFIGFIAALGADHIEKLYAPYLIVGGVFMGSALWWLFLVGVALKLKKHLDMKYLIYTDLIAGLFLCTYGIYLFYSLIA